MTNISIDHIERAINIWRARRPSSENHPILCREARSLADVYALMIVQRAQCISADSLTDEQAAALSGAFGANVE